MDVLRLLRLLWLVAFPMEVISGWFLLGPGSENVAIAPALHAVAVALFGLSLITRVEGRKNWSWPLLGWSLSLFIFPALGMLIAAAAFMLTQTVLWRAGRGMAEVEEAVETERIEDDVVARAREAEISLLDEREVEPVVDVLREDDPEGKRAAIEAITKQRDSGTVRLLRGLLHDPSLEARFFASISLSKLEDEIGKSILSAQRELADNPDLPGLREKLARIYLDYVMSGFLEGAMREYYLELARRAFEEAQEMSPDPDELAIDLARVYLMLGDIVQGAMVLDDLARRRPEDTDLYLARMEVIFEFGDFRELSIYARRTLPKISEDAEMRGLVEWWAGKEGAEQKDV